MKNLFLFALAAILLIGCNKNGYDKFDDATWEKDSFFPLDVELTGSLYGNALLDNKVIRIQSLGELDSIGLFVDPNLSSNFASFDFTENNLFILLFRYEGKAHEEVTKSKISINETSNSILFDFKVKAKVGGSGMEVWSSLYYFTVPIDKSDYALSGSIEMNEKSAVFQNDDHDFTENYTLF